VGDDAELFAKLTLQRVFPILVALQVTTGESDRAGREALGQLSLFREHAPVRDQHERDALDRDVTSAYFFLISHEKPSTGSLPTIGSPMVSLPSSRAIGRFLPPLTW
jgi:hypothetical protein